MAARKALTLDETSRAQLARIIKRGDNWREHERAQTLLRLDAGVFAEDVAAELGLNVRTVRSARRDWLDSGLSSLRDRSRCGAPEKREPEHVRHLVEWAQAEPLTAAALLARHRKCGGPSVHVNTLTASLNSSGLMRKRTRHALKKAATQPPSAKRL